jgi:hypothetical protein
VRTVAGGLVGDVSVDETHTVLFPTTSFQPENRSGQKLRRLYAVPELVGIPAGPATHAHQPYFPLGLRRWPDVNSSVAG